MKCRGWLSSKRGTNGRRRGCSGPELQRTALTVDSLTCLHTDALWSRPHHKIECIPRIVRPKAAERYQTCVPLVPLKAAAGWFSERQDTGEPADWEWTALDTSRRLRAGMFVAQVVGKSMEPQIPDGAYCLFAAPVEGSRQGKTVLVQLRDQTDPEHGGRFTVKRYFSAKASTDDGSWRHVKIELRPNNSDFNPIGFTTDDEESVNVVAEVVEVLG